MRLYLLASSQVWLPKRFDRRAIPEVAGKFLNTLRSTYEFFQLYAGTGAGQAPAPAERPLLDRWILGRLDATVEAVQGAWGGYDVTAGVRAIMDFVVDDLSQLVRAAQPVALLGARRGGRSCGVATLNEALATVGGCSPRRRRSPPTGSTARWREPRCISRGFRSRSAIVDPTLEAGMDAVRRLASLAHHARQQARIGARQPLARMQVAVPPSARGAGFDALLELLRQEVNVKTVDVVASDTELVRLRAKANFRSLGKRYGKRTPAVAAAAGRLAADQLRELEQGVPPSWSSRANG